MAASPRTTDYLGRERNHRVHPGVILDLVGFVSEACGPHTKTGRICLVITIAVVGMIFCLAFR